MVRGDEITVRVMCDRMSMDTKNRLCDEMVRVSNPNPNDGYHDHVMYDAVRRYTSDRVREMLCSVQLFE